ncbi:MAG: hypothetical protein AB3N63_06765 [Puniceicoccaceae bacterium]
MKRIHNKRGSLAIELALAAGVLALIVVTGMSTLRWLIEGNLRQFQSEQAWLDQESFRKSIETAWDHRCSHELRDGPWMDIQSSKDGEHWNLERLWILHYDQAGSLIESSWNREASGWRFIITKVAENPPAMLSRHFQYDGRIRINQGSAQYIGGEGPLLLTFSFPDQRIPRLRQGFAIRRFW